MDLNSIYTELIMEHNASSHNRRHICNADVCEKGHNPSCGDEIELQIKYENEIIDELAFTGQGCAISQASTSMMIDLIKGKNKKEALELIDIFTKMIKREITDDEKLEVLDDAFILKNISNMPARVKCAVLAWHTLKEAMNK